MASGAGIASAFVGNMIHPIKGGADYVPPTPADVAKATAEAERATNEADKKAQELRDAEPFQKAKQNATASPPAPDQRHQLLLSKLKSVFPTDFQSAYNVITLPVTEWKKLAPSDFTKVYRLLISKFHPDKCSLEICGLLSRKLTNMSSCSKGETCESIGDQTEEAIKIIDSNPPTEKDAVELEKAVSSLGSPEEKDAAELENAIKTFESPVPVVNNPPVPFSTS